MRTFDSDPVKRARERARLESIRPIRMDTHNYLVASVSRPGEGYQVVVPDGDASRARCTCRGFEHGHTCKHIGAVIDLLDAGARQSKPLCLDCGAPAYTKPDQFYQHLLCVPCGHAERERQAIEGPRYPWEVTA